jgi:hypothetical protein
MTATKLIMVIVVNCKPPPYCSVALGGVGWGGAQFRTLIPHLMTSSATPMSCFGELCVLLIKQVASDAMCHFCWQERFFAAISRMLSVCVPRNK